MIKLLREAAHDYPWFLKLIMRHARPGIRHYDGLVGIRHQGGNVVASVRGPGRSAG